MPVGKKQSVKILISILALVLFMTSCKEAPEKTTLLSTTTGIYKIELSPSFATKESVISVKVKNVNPSDVSYQWIVNSKEIEGATKNTLEYPDLKKNDKVQVKISIKGGGDLVSDTLIISNIIPKIQKAKLVPRNPKKDDELRVQAETYDEDSESVSLIYEWSLNGNSIDESSGVLNTDELVLKRGDKISVKITPTDGEQAGESITIYSIIANSPPKALHDFKTEINGSVYTAKIKAEDPEEDILTYTLIKAPEGMTIDATTGVITWNTAPKDEGEHDIIISVSDGQGGETIIPITTTITFTTPETE